jgi:hypothetical protein
VLKPTESEYGGEEVHRIETETTATILQNQNEDQMAFTITDILKKYAEFRDDSALLSRYLEQHLVFHELMKTDDRYFREFCERFLMTIRPLPGNKANTDLIVKTVFSCLKDVLPNRKDELVFLVSNLLASFSVTMSPDEMYMLPVAAGPNTMLVVDENRILNNEENEKPLDVSPVRKQTEYNLPEVDSDKPLFPISPVSVAPPHDPVLPLKPIRIMFSYAWGYKKDRVLALEGKLKQLGYDVWREETTMRPEDGSNNCMTRAVEDSSLIIIFICGTYCKSSNCRREAQYCRQRSKPLLFVTLNENYHVSSSSAAVERWLGVLIGTQPLYSFWRLDQLETVSSGIASKIGDILRDSSFEGGQYLKSVVPPPSDPKLPRQHIMFSYSWGYKNDHVIALEEKLKQLGYDVWRDETGQLILPTSRVRKSYIAKAVENSSLIIIFVCKAYFKSEDRKREAEYCYYSKPLIFMMLDENYTTACSAPEPVKGWLRLLMGSVFWYPLWNLDQLESTSSWIVDKIEHISFDSSLQSEPIPEDHRSDLLSEVSLKSIVPPPPDPKLSRQHIMFSYSWGYKSDHVIALEEKLKQLGYDVWRDETGSSVLPPLGVGAVENSSWIIIFVSKTYSEDGFRAAEYCIDLSKPHLFVMLDENYTTACSAPERVKGWLSLLMGSDLWYPLWNLNQLDATSSEIASKIPITHKINSVF